MTLLMTLLNNNTSPVPEVETANCIVCGEITSETCGRCNQPIHHSEERDEAVSCWVHHWRPYCKAVFDDVSLPPVA